MLPNYVPIHGAEGWQISNPPILQMAALRASLDIFDEVGMKPLRAKSLLLTGYLEYLIDTQLSGKVEICTAREPSMRGCQLSLRVKDVGHSIYDKLLAEGVIVDWREPYVIRVAPVPLYNRFADIFDFVEILKRVIG